MDITFQFDAPATAKAHQEVVIGHILVSLLVGAVGTHASIDLVEGISKGVARRLLASNNTNAKRVSNMSILTTAVVGSGLCIAVNGAWCQHALLLLGLRYTELVQRFNLGIRLLSIAAPAVCGVLAVLLLATAPHGPMGTAGVQSRYSFSLAEKSSAVSDVGGAQRSKRKQSTGAAVRGATTNWTAVFREMRGLYTLRLLAAGLLFGAGLFGMKVLDIAALRVRTIQVWSTAGLAVTAGTAWVVGTCVLFIIMHFHGPKARITGSIIASLLFAAFHVITNRMLDTHEFPSQQLLGLEDSEVTVNGRPCIVAVILAGSLVRFVLMGLASTELT